MAGIEMANQFFKVITCVFLHTINQISATAVDHEFVSKFAQEFMNLYTE